MLKLTFRSLHLAFTQIKSHCFGAYPFTVFSKAQSDIHRRKARITLYITLLFFFSSVIVSFVLMCELFVVLFFFCFSFFFFLKCASPRTYLFPWQLFMQSGHVPRLFLSSLFCCVTRELSLQAHTQSMHVHVTYGEMITNYQVSCLANLSITHTNSTKAHARSCITQHFDMCTALGLRRKLAEVLLTLILTYSAATAPDQIHLGCQ